ncbi:MAG TPA: hypothetical protein PLC13_01960 [Bacillota bacterium]|nr:hypothetical protein [Bacillota bacterium]
MEHYCFGMAVIYMKMKIIKKNNKGATLVEIIVGLAVCLIFLSVAFAIISPIGNIFDRSGEKADAQQIANNVMESIRTKTAKSDTLSTSGNKIIYDSGTRFFAVNNEGYLVYGETANPEEARLEYGRSFYSGKTISMTVSSQGTEKLKVIIEVKNKEGNRTVYSTTGILKPILIQNEEESPAFSVEGLVNVNDSSLELTYEEKREKMGDNAEIFYYIFKDYFDSLNGMYEITWNSNPIAFLAASNNEIRGYKRDDPQDTSLHIIYASREMAEIYRESSVYGEVSDGKVYVTRSNGEISIDYVAVKIGDYWGKCDSTGKIVYGNQAADGWSAGTRP